MSDSLTTTEAARLSAAEQRIERGLTTFVEVGEALMEIRSECLYREQYERFEDYCRERWGFGRAQAYRLIEAAAVVSPIGDTGLPLPSSEGVARELPREPEQAQEVWQATVERHGNKPTAAQVREVRTEVVERPAPSAPDPVVRQIAPQPADPHALIKQMSSAIDTWTPLIGKESEIAEQAAQITPEWKEVLVQRLRMLANAAQKTEQALNERPGLRMVGR